MPRARCNLLMTKPLAPALPAAWLVLSPRAENVTESRVVADRGDRSPIRHVASRLRMSARPRVNSS